MLKDHRERLKAMHYGRHLRTAAALLLLAGCSIGHRQTDAPSGRARMVDGVPFFPQRRHQCGPAALAALLGFFGDPIAPDQIAAEIYEPTSAGTSTAAMLAYGARHDLPLHTLRGSFQDVRSELDGGRPLIALHRHGFPCRQYHYVVVTGYDPTDGALYGYSGRDPHARWDAEEFAQFWAGADNWLLVWDATEHRRTPAANRGNGPHDHTEPGKRE